jgi:hypothetical protein
MAITRLFATPDGESRFETKDVVLAAVEFIAGERPLEFSAPTEVGCMMFFRLPAGWSPGWHAAPRRQYCFVQQGAMHIETTDGRKCRIGPGDTLLVENTTGKGHLTTVPEGICTGVVVTLPES